jgi:hypothetical protein
MLRYKNSLLERILLEKGKLNYLTYIIASDMSIGIDVQAELRAKTGSPHLGPTHMPQNMVQPPTVQRAIMNRHHQARRSNSNIAPKLEPGAPPAPHSMNSNPSPQSRPTPSSHHSSPTTNSPVYAAQGVLTPPASDAQMQMQQQQQQGRLQPLKPQVHHGLPGSQQPGGIGPLVAMKGPGSSGQSSMGGVPAAYYSGPFQNHQTHIEQLGKLTPSFLSYFFNRAMFVLD